MTSGRNGSRAPNKPRRTYNVQICACHQAETQRTGQEVLFEIVLICNRCNCMYRTLECLSNHSPRCNLEKANPIDYCTAKMYCLKCDCVIPGDAVTQHMRVHLWREICNVKFACLSCCVVLVDETRFLNHFMLHQNNPGYVISDTERVEFRYEKEYKYLHNETTPAVRDNFTQYGNFVCEFCSALYMDHAHFLNHVYAFCTRNPNNRLNMLTVEDDFFLQGGL